MRRAKQSEANPSPNETTSADPSNKDIKKKKGMRRAKKSEANPSFNETPSVDTSNRHIKKKKGAGRANRTAQWPNLAPTTRDASTEEVDVVLQDALVQATSSYRFATQSREQGPDVLVQPGAYPVRSVNATDDANAEDTWGGFDTSEQAGIVEGVGGYDGNDDDLLSAQLVDPGAERLQRQLEVQMLVDERFAQQGAKSDDNDTFCACCVVCGIDFSKRTNQVICLLVVAFGFAALLAALFATGMIGPQSSVAATSSSGSNPPDRSGSRPSFPPSRSPISTLEPSLPQGPSVDATSAPVATASPASPRPVTGPPVTLAPIAPSVSTHPSASAVQWVQVGDDIDGEASNDRSGFATALSSNGTVLAIAARWNDNGGSDAGRARMYVNTGEAWVPRGSPLDGSAGDEFGWSLALSADGTILAVGARLADGMNGANSGRVHIFQWIRIGSSWQSTESTIDGETPSDQFGYSVSLSNDGNILAVGAPYNNAGGNLAGRVRIFAWTGTDWNQRGGDLDGSSAGDWFGDSVSLSSDGSILACGGDQTDNSGPGYVRVFRWSGSAWMQEGSTLLGFSSNDHFGESVSLSGDGRVVAAGADNGNSTELTEPTGSRSAKQSVVLHPVICLASHCPCPLMAPR